MIRPETRCHDARIVGDMRRSATVDPSGNHFAEENGARLEPAGKFSAISCLSALAKQAVDRDLPRDENLPHSAILQLHQKYAAFGREFHG